MAVTDLFIAGKVTTSTTLFWTLLVMDLHLDVQHESGWGWEGGKGKLHSLS